MSTDHLPVTQTQATRARSVLTLTWPLLPAFMSPHSVLFSFSFFAGPSVTVCPVNVASPQAPNPPFCPSHPTHPGILHTHRMYPHLYPSPLRKAPPASPRAPKPSTSTRSCSHSRPQLLLFLPAVRPLTHQLHDPRLLLQSSKLETQESPRSNLLPSHQVHPS